MSDLLDNQDGQKSGTRRRSAIEEILALVDGGETMNVSEVLGKGNSDQGVSDVNDDVVVIKKKTSQAGNSSKNQGSRGHGKPLEKIYLPPSIQICGESDSDYNSLPRRGPPASPSAFSDNVFRAKTQNNYFSIGALKIITIGANFLLFIVGISLASLFISTLLYKWSFASLLPSNTYLILVILTLFSGLLSFVASLFGTIGALKYKLQAMRWNILLFSISLLLETIGIILGIYYTNQLQNSSVYYKQANEYRGHGRSIKNDITDILHYDLLESFDKFGVDEKITESINNLQREHHCCGIERYSDWKNTTWSHLESTKYNQLKVPDSCCITEYENCGHNARASNIYRVNGRKPQGCKNRLAQTLREQVWLIIVSLGFTASVQESD